VSWDLDGGGHEGWAAPVLGDGREAHGSSGHGQFARGVTGKYPVDPYMPDVEIVPDDHVVGWRGACECGWRGEAWTRVFEKELEDLSLLRSFIASGDYADASAAVEEAIHREWDNHVAPSLALEEIRLARQACLAAEQKLTAAVLTARAAKATWSDIGNAAGMSRQSAHQRWEPFTKVSEDRQQTAG
jgi:hypothetical protein